MQACECDTLVEMLKAKCWHFSQVTSYMNLAWRTLHQLVCPMTNY